MRNREQIYGQEAAGLLRNITVYHCMRRDQLLRLYPGKEGVIENLLRYLVKQQRIFYNTDRDCYGDVPDCREDRELTAALWVLLDFIEKVEYHSPDNMPAKLVFFADGEVYEVVYVGPGREDAVPNQDTSVPEGSVCPMLRVSASVLYGDTAARDAI